MQISQIIDHELKNNTDTRPSDQASIQSRVRPTDSPSSLTDMQNKYCAGCYDMYSIHSYYKGSGRVLGRVLGVLPSDILDMRMKLDIENVAFQGMFKTRN